MVPNSRTETYQLVDGVATYGGFNGTEVLLEERDWSNQPTVLSGDVDSNDINVGGVVLDPGNIRGANSHHIVTGSSLGDATILDGFVLTAGQANGDPLDQADRGAGLYNDASSPTLANLTFTGSFAENGGGLANVNGSNPPMSDVQFQSNAAGSFGGAIYNEASHPSLTGVQFQSNAAGSNGGAIYNKDSDPSLTGVQFQSNTSGSYGGAIYNEDSDPSLANALLSGNTASAGAAIYNKTSHPSLTDALLSGNSAAAGAAIHNTASNPILVNVTVTGNRASSSAGGMFNTSTSQPTVHNSIFWDNQDSTGTGTASATIHNEDAGSVSLINYSLVQALSGIEHTGANNLDRYPWFTTPLDPSAAPTTAGDFGLGVLSPAIDVGDNAANSTLTDLAGNPRTINGIIDLGAYEAPYRPVYHTYLPVVLRNYP
jgi:predicted outer membrane repeat protein